MSDEVNVFAVALGLLVLVALGIYQLAMYPGCVERCKPYGVGSCSIWQTTCDRFKVEPGGE